MKQDQENQNNQKIVPLSSDEIKSILKSQTESVFEDKNISNNSNFVKKTLIDIALDFESKQNIEENKDNKVTNDVPDNNTNLVDENDCVAAEVEGSAMHVSGKPYNNKYHFLLKIKDNKILELKEYMDTQLAAKVLLGE